MKHREIDTQTDRQIDRQTETQTDRQSKSDRTNDESRISNSQMEQKIHTKSLEEESINGYEAKI